MRTVLCVERRTVTNRAYLLQPICCGEIWPICSAQGYNSQAPLLDTTMYAWKKKKCPKKIADSLRGVRSAQLLRNDESDSWWRQITQLKSVHEAAKINLLENDDRGHSVEYLWRLIKRLDIRDSTLSSDPRSPPLLFYPWLEILTATEKRKHF